MAQEHAISWFEIPTTDLDRAQRFYETIFGVPLVSMDMPGMPMRVFPVENMMTGVSGALLHAPEFNRPQSQGTMVYLNANPDLQTVLDKVTAAGGSIEMPKTEITPEIGFMAVIIDTEGNRVGLHSLPANIPS